MKPPKDQIMKVQVVGKNNSLQSRIPLAGLCGWSVTWGLRQGPNLIEAAVWNLGQWEKS